MNFNRTLFERLTSIKNFFLFLSIIAIINSACSSSHIYEHANELNGSWYADSSLSFSFNIDDKLSPYDMLYTIDYTDDYPFNNLYIKFELLHAGTGTSVASSLDNMQLFDAITGKPLGSGGGTYRQSIRFVRKGMFKESGQYTLICRQYMRNSPLVGLQSFGVKIIESEED